MKRQFRPRLRWRPIRHPVLHERLAFVHVCFATLPPSMVSRLRSAIVFSATLLSLLFSFAWFVVRQEFGRRVRRPLDC